MMLSPHDGDLPAETELPDAGDLQLVDLESQLAHRRSPRQKLISVGVLAVVVMLAVVGLQYSHVLPQVGLLGVAPTPTATLPTRVTGFGRRFTPQQIAISTNLNGGAITLNGAPVPPPQYGPFLTATLNHGKNTLRLSAPPFAPLACTISYPPDPTADTCRQTGTVNGAPLVDLSLGWDALAPSQQQQVMTTVATYINQLDDPSWHTTVPVGQYYAIGYDPKTGLPIANVATSMMTVGLKPVVASANAPFADCQYIICPSPGAVFLSSAEQSSVMHWMITVHITLAWRFSALTGAGTIVVPAMPPAAANVPASVRILTDAPDIPLLLTYDAATGWRIVPEAALTPDQLFQAACAFGSQLIAANAAAQGANASPVASTSQPSIAGCRIVYSFNSTGNSPQFVYRFGVLLAGNADAHSLFPTLPVAPPAENAAVPDAS